MNTPLTILEKQIQFQESIPETERTPIQKDWLAASYRTLDNTLRGAMQQAGKTFKEPAILHISH